MNPRGLFMQHASTYTRWPFRVARGSRLYSAAISQPNAPEAQQDAIRSCRQDNSAYRAGHLRCFSTGRWILQESSTAPLARPSRSSGTWSNTYAENLILNPQPSSNIRSRLQQWQMAQSQPEPYGFDFPMAGGDRNAELFVRPGLPNVLRDDSDNIDAFNHPQMDAHPDEDVYKAKYQPGDLVDLAASGGPTILAVLVGILGRQYQFYAINGKIVHVSTKKNYIFCFPRFINPAELEPLKPFTPTSEVLDEFMSRFADVDATVPRNVTSPILKRMADFRQKADDLYRQNSAIFDAAHSIVAHKTKMTYISPENLAKRLLGQFLLDDESLRWPALFAVSHFVAKRIPGFAVNLKTFNTTNMIPVDSKQTVLRVNRVVKWVRAFQEENALLAAGSPVPKAVRDEAGVLTGFLTKAKVLIARSRTERILIPGCGVGPHQNIINGWPAEENSSTLTTPAIFSSCDQDIIHFLLVDSLTCFAHNQMSLISLRSTIVQATGAYNEHSALEKMNDQQDVWNLLVEIGAVLPWQNAFDPDREILPLPDDVQTNCDEFKHALKKGDPPEVAAGLSDAFKSRRHDWGDIPVYCIDPANTRDVDDGISVESVTGTNYECWLHVHVAHPSAFFSKDSFVGRHALHEVISTYLPDARPSMLPEPLISQFNVTTGGAVLTFSARLSRDGAVLESKVRPGIVHNVFNLDPGVVRELLLAPDQMPEQDRIYQVGVSQIRDGESLKPQQEYPEHIKKDLAFLSEFCQAFHNRRSQDQEEIPNQSGTVKLPNYKGGISVTPLNEDRMSPKYSYDDPTIIYNTSIAQKRSQELSAVDSLVRESMIIAGYVGAMFCRDRNIPIIYQGTREAVANLDTKLLYSAYSAAAKLGMKEYGQRLVASYRFTGNIATTPLEHRGIGLEVYAQVTSPIRRGRDLIAGWQIDAALHEEARLGKNLQVGEEVSSLPFTKEDLDNFIPWLWWKEKHTRMFAKTQELHWVTQFLFRAHYFKECALPEPLLMTIEDAAHWKLDRYHGPLHELMLKCTLDARDESLYEGELPRPKVERGDVWQVAVLRISTYYKAVHVRPVRLVRRALDSLKAIDQQNDVLSQFSKT